MDYQDKSGCCKDHLVRYQRLVQLAKQFEAMSDCKSLSYNMEPASSLYEGKVSITLGSVIFLENDATKIYAQMCALSDKVSVMSPTGKGLFLYFYVSLR